MTAPLTAEALVEKLARTMWEQSYAIPQDASWDVALQIAKHIPDGQAASCLATVRSKAHDFIAGPLAPLLAAEASLQRVTAERDEARADQKAAEDSNDALNEKLHALAPHGSCACSYDKPGDVCGHHSPALATANAEAARLRGDVEALKGALTLCLAELDWQVNAAEHCGDPDRECPMQDIGKPSGEHAQARDAARTALARAATEKGQAVPPPATPDSA